tara:strand:- start:2237 stop:2428 length:192 start_codon:yes stop_codon:yes gene_type:complete
MLNRRDEMKSIMRQAILVAMTMSTWLMAQGITLPDEPSQAPIGGLGLLAALGGAMAYKKLRKK